MSRALMPFAAVDLVAQADHRGKQQLDLANDQKAIKARRAQKDGAKDGPRQNFIEAELQRGLP